MKLEVGAAEDETGGNAPNIPMMMTMTMSDNDNAKDDKEIQLHVCSFALVLVGDETCGRLSVRLDALSI